MRLFDVAQPVIDGRIHIPFAMRAALGWHVGSHLFCWGHPDESEPSLHQNQLSISAFVPNSRELWGMTARFHDRPGMLAELASLLTTHQVDVISCRGSTQLQNSEFTVDMELDLSSYRSTYDLSSTERKRQPGRGVRELHARLVCRFAKELVFLPDGTPALTLTRNPVLSGAIAPSTFRHDTALQGDGLFSLPDEIIDTIRSHFVQRYPDVGKLKGKASSPLALLVADARWGIVDATFFYRNTGHKHVRVRARDRIGTLKLITSELRNHGFNLLQLYSRAVTGSDHSITDILMHLRDDKSRNDNDLQTYIRGTFRGKALRDLEPEVSFPAPEVRKRRGGG